MIFSFVQEIYLEALKNKKRTFSNFLRDALKFLIENHENLSKISLEIGCKAFFQLLANSGEPFLVGGFNLEDSRLAVNLVNGILSTDYRKCVEAEKLQEIVLNVAKLCSREHSVFVLWALRNLANYCKLHPDFEHDFEAILEIVWMNMTSCVSGVREQNLFLLEFFTKKRPERSKSIIRVIIQRWSWTNPYKYYLLGVIIGNLKFEDLAEDDLELLLEGLSTSLKHRNLLSPGQYLFKSLVKHREVDICKLVRDILLTRNLLEADNFINHWLCMYPNLGRLFEKLNFDLESMDLSHYILVQRAFRDQLVNSPLREVSLDGLKAVLRQHFYEILIHRLTKNPEINQTLSILRDFFELHASDENTGLRHYIFKRFPVILDQLARRNRGESAEILKFFQFLKGEIIDSGLQSDPEEYQPIIFGLRMMDTFLKFLSGDRKYQLTKNSNVQANIHLSELLAREGVKFSSRDDFTRLLEQLKSNFDDIQELSCNIINEFFVEKEFREEILKIFMQTLSSENTIESAGSCHFYARILSDRPGMFLDVLEKSLREGFEKFQKDPFAAVQSGQHIFHKIACLREIFTPDEQLNLLVDLCAEITEKILNFLNHTGEFEEAPSFEVMEESLQVLIEKSNVEAVASHQESRKLLLLSLWMTLRACGDFAAESSRRSPGTRMSTCLKINTSILQRCRHKGAIEAAGLSLGTIVRVISGQECHIGFLLKEIENLLTGKRKLSTTRRGAGYSIMLLNLIRNDQSDGRKLLQHVMNILLKGLRQESCNQENCDNLDNLEAVMLHYLCVLVKDSSLAEDILPFIPEILWIAFHKIDSYEWTVRNGALQLCGALIPKIVGQKTHFQEIEEWQPVRLSVDDLRIRLADINSFLLATLRDFRKNSTTMLITILELLSRIEFWWTEIHSPNNIQTFRSILWTLLSHPRHKIRLLSAKCFAGFHEFHQIPGIIFQIINILPEITDQNTFHGLILASDALTRKYRCESFAIPEHNSSEFLTYLQNEIQRCWSNLPERKLCPFIRIYLKKYLKSIESPLANEILIDLLHV